MTGINHTGKRAPGGFGRRKHRRRGQLLVLVTVLVCSLLFSACGSGGMGENGMVNSASGLEDADQDDTGAKRYSRMLAHKNQQMSEGDETLTAIDKTLPLREKNWTVMIYMTGSNLESQLGSASSDLEEMKNADVDYAKTNIVVYTGGCQRWNSSIPADKNCVLDISKDDDAWVSAQTASSADMGAPATFREFVNFSAENYPAEHYALILWDHGGGPVFGYGSDELFNSDALLLSEIKTAMDGTIFSENKKIDLVGFDACLMGNLETANVWKDYADYMIASEELENGDGWDYAFLSELGQSEDAEELADSILEYFGDYYERNTTAFSHPDATLSVFDLGKVGSVIDALDSLCGQMEESIDTGAYYSLSRARNVSKAFGLEASEDRGSGYDLIDLGDFAGNLDDSFSKEKKKLTSAIDALVVAQRSNVEDTYGVSIYFPGDNKTLFSETAEDYYKDDAVSAVYSEFLKNFTDEWIAADSVDWKLSAPEKSGDEYTLKLSDDQVNHMSEAAWSVLRKRDIGGYAYLSCFNAVTPDDRNVLHIPADPEVFTAVIGGIESNVPFMVRQISDGESETQYQSLSLILSAGQEFQDLDSDTDQNIRLNLSADKTDDTVTIRSVELSSGTLDNAGKSNADLAHAMSLVQFLGGGYTPSYNENGTIKPFNEWENIGSYIYYSFQMNDDFHFIKKRVSDYDGDYIVQVTVRDINGSIHGSDLAEFAVGTPPENTVEVQTDRGKITYTINDDSAGLTSYEGTDTSLTIPETIEGKPVTSIGSRAFLQVTGLDSISLPSSLERIEEGAFLGDSALASISLPDTLREIGANAFLNCASLKTLDIPDSVSHIGASAFQGTAIREIRIPSSLKTLEHVAFGGMDDLAHFVQDADNAVTCVLEGVLFSRDKKTLICYPPAHGDSYEIPDGTETIAYGAFARTSVRHIIFPETLRRISNFAFFECSDLADLDFPDSLEDIGHRAFGTIIRSSLNEDYPVIDTVHIGKNVSFIGVEAFRMYDVRRFEVDPENKRYSSVDGFLANKEGDVLIMAPLAGRDEAAVPEGVVSLTDGLFADYEDNADIALPSTLKNIPDDALPHGYSDERDADGYYERTYDITIHCPENSYAEQYAKKYDIAYDNDTDRETGTPVEKETAKGNCTYKLFSDHAELVTYAGDDETLEVLSEADGLPVTVIGDGKNAVFQDGNGNPTYGGFSTIVIPDSVQEIRAGAFSGQKNLENINIPASVNEIGEKAFSGTGIVSFSVEPENVSYCTLEGVLYTADQKTLVAYPEGNYPEDGSFTVPNGTEEIADGAFDGIYGSLTSVTFPESLTAIGNDAFHFTGLEKIIFPKHLERIGESAFSGTDVTEVVLPDSLKEMGKEAFSYCDKLEKVTISGSLKVIPENAFADCTKLGNVTLPDGVKTIGSKAFLNCSSLTEVVIPDSVSAVGDDAFACWSRSKNVKTARVYVGRKVKELNAEMFEGRVFDAFEVSEKNKAFMAEGSLLLSADGEELIACAAGAGTFCAIPDTVTGIRNYAFITAVNVTDVSVPDSVRDIEDRAFDTGWESERTITLHCSGTSAARTYADSLGMETVITSETESEGS